MKSVTSARLAAAAAKKAALPVDVEHQKEINELQMEELRLQQQRKRTELKHALAIASAEEKVSSERGILEETMPYCEDTSVSDARFKTQNWVELQSNDVKSQHETQPVVAPVYVPVLQNKENQDTSVLKCIQDGQEQQRRLIEVIYLPKTELPVFNGDP